VCGNDQITISAGISVNKPGEPVESISERAENALAKAKENTVSSASRNSIAIFEEAVKWKTFDELSDIGKTIETWINKQYISKIMLYRLDYFSNLSEQEKEILETKDDVDMEEYECLKWGAMFKYALVRNIGRSLKGDERDMALCEVEKAAEWIRRYGSRMKIPLWQIIYNQR
jgi:CRISPR-associated protein Csm1